MSDNWGFYPCQVEGQLASIFVNLQLAEDAPLEDYPNMGYLRLYLTQVNEEGMPTTEEAKNLSKLEIILGAGLAESSNVIYAGRQTSDGLRDFYFYLKTGQNLEGLIAKTLASFPQYKFETGIEEEGEWETYFDFLYPSSWQWQMIQNQLVCESLKKAGDHLEQARIIDHWITFPSKKDYKAFQKEIQPLGFAIQGVTKNKGGNPEELFCLQLQGEGIPTNENIDDLVFQVYDIALNHNGNYDGWGCATK